MAHRIHLATGTVLKPTHTGVFTTYHLTRCAQVVRPIHTTDTPSYATCPKCCPSITWESRAWSMWYDFLAWEGRNTHVHKYQTPCDPFHLAGCVRDDQGQLLRHEHRSHRG
jgi:hypothetical protein